MSGAADMDYTAQVQEYLAYCEDARAELEAGGSGLDSHHHPTTAGCLKMIPHGSNRVRADAIRRAFSELTSEVTGPGRTRPGDSPGRKQPEPEGELEASA